MRGIGGFGVMDEVFHPEASAARDIREAEAVLPAPTPVAGDPPFDLDSGSVTIVVPARAEAAATDAEGSVEAPAAETPPV